MLYGHSTFFQRLTTLGWIQIIALLVIVLRLFFLQVLYSDRYKILAEENRTRMRVQFAPRGHITDRWDVPIVKNIKHYNAVIVPQEAGDLAKALNFVGPLLNLSPTDKKSILKKAKTQPRFVPIMLKNNLTWHQTAILELHNTELPGIYTEEGRARDYKLDSNALHLIGYISSPSRAQAEANRLFLMPGAKIGKTGIEQFYEDEIQGTIGQRAVEINARGRIVRELRNSMPQAGKDFALTIDADLQSYVGKLLAPYKSAAAVVLDAHSGSVLSMVSTPGYDPSLFYNGISHEDWGELINSPYGPMSNKVISGQYSPGSAFKIVIALAALKAGINPNEKIFCPGYTMVGNHRFHCWKYKGHGHMDMREALYESCDVYFYHIAQKIRMADIVDMAKILGVSQPTGIDLYGERKGFIATPEWKKRVKKEPWYTGDTILTSIGQGYVLMTPIQMAQMLSILINGGQKIPPHLKRDKAIKTEAKDKNKINPHHIQYVLSSLAEAANNPKGTVYRARIRHPKYAMGGKTSTAQVRRITMKERLSGIRQSKDLPWHLRDTAQFIGFAPIDNPRYVVAVVGEHEGWGGVFAAPKGRDILYKTQKIMERKESQHVQ
jgi:penicillin-binding protein 2